MVQQATKLVAVSLAPQQSPLPLTASTKHDCFGRSTAAFLNQNPVRSLKQQTLITGVNDDSLVAFEQSRRAQKSLSIQLRGKDGNTCAASARINIKFDDGTRRSIEVAAGSGYLSQSASLINIGLPSGIKVVDLELQWPDGTSKKLNTVDVDKTVEIQQ